MSQQQDMSRDGGPAFPSPPIEGATDDRAQQRDGATLRDLFACFALVAIQRDPGCEQAAPVSAMPASTQANTAYRLADAMLRAREAA